MPCCFSCNSGSNPILSPDTLERLRNSWWEQQEVPAALPSSSSTVPGTTATHAGCLSKIKLLRMAGTLRKKLKKKFQCKVLVKEMADPVPSYLSLLQTQYFTVTLPQFGAFVKGLYDFKIHSGLQLFSSRTQCPEIWLKKRAVQLPTTCLYGSSHLQYSPSFTVTNLNACRKEKSGKKPHAVCLL